MIAAQGGELKRALAQPRAGAADRSALPGDARRARARTRCARLRSRPTAGSDARRSSRTCPSFASRLAAHVVNPASGALRDRCADGRSRWPNGGIHDQLGGGFCRYSVDRTWTIPHFEKMLYDNGPLLGAVCRPRARHRRAGVRACARRHRRVARARDARGRRRVLLEPRRRQRRRGGQVLRLDARGGRVRCSPTRNTPSPRRISASTTRRTSRVVRGTCAIARVARTTSRSRLASRCPRRSRALACARAKLVRCARAAACARAATTRSSRRGTRWRSPGLRALRAGSRHPAWAELAFTAADALQATRMARRAAARDAQGRARAPQRVPRRLRVPARRT